ALGLAAARPRGAPEGGQRHAGRARRLGAGRRRGARMTSHAEALGHGHEHGAHPPTANVSSRVPASILGMLLFIASDIMLFGSFFTAYFFDRVVNNAKAWPPPPYHFPIFVAGI